MESIDAAATTAVDQCLYDIYNCIDGERGEAVLKREVSGEPNEAAGGATGSTEHRARGLLPFPTNPTYQDYNATEKDQGIMPRYAMDLTGQRFLPSLRTGPEGTNIGLPEVSPAETAKTLG